MKWFWKTLSIVVLVGATLAISNQCLYAGSPGHGGGHVSHGGNGHFDLGLGRFNHGHSDFDRNRNGFGFDGFGFNGFGFWGCDLGANDERIPYYSLFPPVYYSRIVPRAYGWSPFAYSPDAIVLPLEEGGPQQIINPYVPRGNAPAPEAVPAPGTKTKPTADKTAADTDLIRVIDNPYVVTTLANGVE